MAKTETTYPKPTPAKGLPKWYLQIRAGSDFMPNKIKPVSYNFMAAASSPNRAVIYGASNPSIEPGRYPLSATGKSGPITDPAIMRTDMGTYFRPTEDVEAKVKKNYSIIQSIKTLGGEVKKRAGSLLHIVGDVLARPRYAVMNAYKENMEYWTQGAESAGGARVTGSEQVSNALWGMTPLAIVKNAAAGRLDDDLVNLWKGLSGKEKTGMSEILQSQTPGWVKDHPKAAGIAAITGDVLLDPLMLVSVATVPGSIVRGAGSGLLRVAGRKESALKLWDETFFSSKGRTTAINTLRKDILQKDVNKLNRKLRRVEKDATRKNPKMEAAARFAKENELKDALKAKMHADLRGTEFAWRVLKRSIPTLGMGTISRLSTAAAYSGTAAAGIGILAKAHAANTAATVDDLIKETRWGLAYEAMKGEDITYQHGGKTYTVDLADKTDHRSWLTRVVEEAAPMAAYNEYSAKTARSRGGRIHATEARGHGFLAAFDRKFDDKVTPGLKYPERDLYRFGKHAAGVAAKSNKISEADVNKGGFHVVSEDDLSKATFDELKQGSIDAWKAAGGKGRRPTRAQVVIKYDDGTYRRVSVSALREQAENASDAAAGRVLDEVALAGRTRQQAAVDRMAGVSDAAAARRDRLLDIAKKRQAAIDADQAATTAGNEAFKAYQVLTADNGAVKVAGALQAVLNKMPELNDGERAALNAILNDTSKTPAERVSAVLASDMIDDQTALDSVRSIFQTVIADDQVFASLKGEGSGIRAIREIMQNVIDDRWAARVPEAEMEASGIGFDPIARQLNHIADRQSRNPNYLRDIHGEIGMMLMDAYHYAIDYAVRTDSFKNPATLFAHMDGPMQHFMNQASAETKSQVMQLMYNLTGMRLPEDFVPLHTQVDTIRNIEFKDNTGKVYENQDKIWSNLGVALQEHAVKLFPELDRSFRATNAKGQVIAGGGWNINAVGVHAIQNAERWEPYTPPAGGIKSFTTEKGSKYVRGADGKYTRHKSQEIIDMHGQAAVDTMDNTRFIKNPDLAEGVQRAAYMTKNKPVIKVVDGVTHMMGIEISPNLDMTKYMEYVRASKASGKWETDKLNEYQKAVEAGGGQMRKYWVKTSDEPIIDSTPLEWNEGGGFHRGHTVTEIDGGHNHTTKTRAYEKASKLRAQIDTLHNEIARMGDGTINGDIKAVNRYSMIDFLMHSDAILKSQRTTLVTTGVGGGKYTNRLNMGRLSALDSFTFASDEAQAALKAIEDLKAMSRSANKDTAEAAQIELAHLFTRNGGIEYLREVQAPASGKLSELDFTAPLKRLGTHAALKDEALRNENMGSAFGAKYRADLMDELWGHQSLVHEWQKSFQNKILHDVYIKGITKEESAKQLAKNIDDAFFNYKRIKKMIYPVKRNAKDRLDAEGLPLERGPMVSTVPDIEGNQWSRTRTLQQSWGKNEFEGTQNSPYVEDELSAEFGKTRHDPRVLAEDMTESGALINRVKPMPPRKEFIPGEEKAVPFRADSPQVAKAADAHYKKVGHDAAKAEAARAVIEYADSIKSDVPPDIPVPPTTTPAAVPDPTAPTPAGAGIQEPVTDQPLGAPDVTSLNDNPDFANVAPVVDKLDPTERNAVVDWIRKTYEDAPPEAVAAELRSISIALSMDLMEAQARLLTQTADLGIKHGRRVRFAGIPLMPVTGPVNATHSLSGVVAMDQQRAFASRFFGGRFKRVPDLDQAEMTRAQTFAFKYSRQSQVLEGSLERIRMGVVNASSMERKHFIGWINDLYVGQINKGQFQNPNVQNMKPRQRADYLAKAFFDPNYGKVPDRLDEFEPVDGLNPAKVIEANIEDIAHNVFAGLGGKELLDQIVSFNGHLNERYRLSPQHLAALTGVVDSEKVLPFSREWMIAVGRLQGNKFGKMADGSGNIGELHYGLQDAKLKMRAGRELHEGVFEEFTFDMLPDLVKFNNDVLRKQTMGAKGEPMRGEIASVKDLIDRGILDAKYVPREYRLGDKHIQMDMIPHINMMFKYMDEVGRLTDTLDIDMVNKVLNYFKASVTIYKIPTYPVKNTMSDIFMGAMDGLTNPRYYKDAAEIIFNHHKAMKEISLEDYEKIIDPRFVKESIAKAVHDPESVKSIDDITPNMRSRMILMTESGQVKLNDSQIMHIYDRMGLGQNRVAGEFNESVAAVRMSAAGKKAGQGHDLVKNFNDAREDWARVAHLMFAMEKEAPFGGSLDDIALRAADRVMKFHFDYGDTSLWERGRVAKHIPFYKWVKNIIPFTINSMVTTPRYIAIEQAISQGVGTAINDNPDEMGFKDFVLPEYIARENNVPIGWFMNNNGNKFNQYMMMNFPLSETISKTLAPTIDPWINGEFEGGLNKFEESGKGFATTALSMTTPVHKAVMQAVFGQVMWPTGAAPEKADESWMKTLSAVVPGIPTLDTLAKDITPNKKEEGYTGFNKAGKVLETLGASNVSNNTESAQIGSLMVTEDRLSGALQKRKAEVMKMVQGKFPQLTDDQAKELVDYYVKEKKKANG